MAIFNIQNREGKRIAANTAAQDRIQVARINANQQYQERQSAAQASIKSTEIRALGQTAAASLQAGVATTNTQRLLSEFEAGLAQRQALRQRQIDQAVGQSKAAFGAANIQSIGAQQEARREQTIAGNIEASQGNTQREQLLGQARQSITNALATGIGAASSLQASSVSGKLFERQVSSLTGDAPDYIKIKTGIDKGRSDRYR